MELAGLNTSQEVLNYMLKSNGFNPAPYFEDGLVKIGYGHRVAKTWLNHDRVITEEEALNFFISDLKKIEANPLIQELKDDQILYDICVHFIYDHGIQPFKNCRLNILTKRKRYDAILEVFEKAAEHFKHCKIRARRLHDIRLLLSKGVINGNKKRIPKKNVGFSG